MVVSDEVEVEDVVAVVEDEEVVDEEVVEEGEDEEVEAEEDKVVEDGELVEVCPELEAAVDEAPVGDAGVDEGVESVLLPLLLPALLLSVLAGEEVDPAELEAAELASSVDEDEAVEEAVSDADPEEGNNASAADSKGDSLVELAAAADVEFAFSPTSCLRTASINLFPSDSSSRLIALTASRSDWKMPSRNLAKRWRALWMESWLRVDRRWKDWWWSSWSEEGEGEGEEAARTAEASRV